MKKTLLTSFVLAGLLATTSAQANEAVVGAVIGGGMGGLIGQSVGGRDGAVMGGLVGAIAGAALARNNDHRHVHARHGAPAYYAHPAPRYYATPAHYGRPVVTTPVYYRGRPEWRRNHHDRHDYHERRGNQRHWR